MQIEHFIKRLEKLSASNSTFVFMPGNLLKVDDFNKIEDSLKITIPAKVKDFYLVANGLKTINPTFEIIDLLRWTNDDGLIHFATFDELIKIYFKATELNDAGEWTIFCKYNNYDLTLTISSFWSNKLWHWLEQEHNIWEDNWLETKS
jgi:hypothetical protein